MIENDFRHVMPCGFVRTHNVVKNLMHYNQCDDFACIERAQSWAITIAKLSKNRESQKSILIKLPALDKLARVGKVKTKQTNKKGNTMKKANKPAKAKSKAKKAVAKVKDTGFIAAIRALALKGGGGKLTNAEAAEKLHGQYPEKDLASIKHICMNVVRRMRKDPDTADIRWKPSTAVNTGYMARIDELVMPPVARHTSRQVAEKVVEEFEGKNLISAKKVVRARIKRLRDSGKPVRLLLESAIREKKSKTTPKAAKKAGKVKIAGKISKAKGKPRKKAGKVKAKNADDAADAVFAQAEQAAA